MEVQTLRDLSVENARFSEAPSRPLLRVHYPVVFLAILGALFLGFAWQQGAPDRRAPEPRVATPRGDLLPEEKVNIDIFSRVSPSVVHITTSALGRPFMSRDVYRIPEGSGTGLIWDETGHIVTNYHVIRSVRNRQGAEILATLSDHSVHPATLVGAAEYKDLAVLRIEADRQKLPPIQIGTSADLRVGQRVLAIGNPFGLDQTLTTGIVSALDREIESVMRTTIWNVIQTDAAINPGNSGGPLLDSAGRLIGVNTAIASPSGAYAGIGFAIPVDTVIRVVPDLIRFGAVRRPVLGIQINDSVQSRIGIKGVLVWETIQGEGADRAGIIPTRQGSRGYALGDIILAIDGRSTASRQDLESVLEDYKVGDEVTLTVLRDPGGKNEQLRVPVVLSEAR